VPTLNSTATRTPKAQQPQQPQQAGGGGKLAQLQKQIADLKAAANTALTMKVDQSADSEWAALGITIGTDVGADNVIELKTIHVVSAVPKKAAAKSHKKQAAPKAIPKKQQQATDNSQLPAGQKGVRMNNQLDPPAKELVYFTLDNETPKQVSTKFEMDPKTVVAMNKVKLQGLSANSKLFTQTELLLPCDTQVLWSSPVVMVLEKAPDVEVLQQGKNGKPPPTEREKARLAHLMPWINAVADARAFLKLQGFQVPKKGTRFHKIATYYKDQYQAFGEIRYRYESGKRMKKIKKDPLPPADQRAESNVEDGTYGAAAVDEVGAGAVVVKIEDAEDDLSIEISDGEGGEDDDGGAMVEEDEDGFKLYEAIDNETPKQIAVKVGFTVKELIALNKERLPGLRQHSKLMAGTVLLLPKEEEEEGDAAALLIGFAVAREGDAAPDASLKRPLVEVVAEGGVDGSGAVAGVAGNEEPEAQKAKVEEEVVLA
jgi:hypothetical protein